MQVYAGREWYAGSNGNFFHFLSSGPLALAMVFSLCCTRSGAIGSGARLLRYSSGCTFGSYVEWVEFL